ncbi:MAG: uroporphyrinogen-III synthase [Ginsengibacter sp.]
MSSNKFTILSTRPLSRDIIEAAAVKNVSIEEIEFITTEAITDAETLATIKTYVDHNATVIFTSMNAVEAVAAQAKIVPEWRVYSMGNTTKNLVNKYFGDFIIDTGHDATDLANAIIANNEQEVVFFCGDKRRDELPETLSRNNISIKDVIVYKTIALDKIISKQYDGILFYSPSAVESFFKNNTINNETVMFAIGDTTAATIREHTSNSIIVSDDAGKEKLVEKAISFYQNRIGKKLFN